MLFGVVCPGGVLSGIGKGVTASSIGVLCKMMGLRPTAIKIDPYLNVDAGTMSPFEHGEVRPRVCFDSMSALQYLDKCRTVFDSHTPTATADGILCGYDMFGGPLGSYSRDYDCTIGMLRSLVAQLVLCSILVVDIRTRPTPVDGDACG